MRFKRLMVSGTVCLCVSTGSAVRGDITLVQPTAANHIPTSNCPAADGTNTLVPDPVTHLAPPAAGSAILTELATGDTNFAGWTFISGPALNGTLTVDVYKSRFLGVHWSGGEIDARYNMAAGENSICAGGPNHGGPCAVAADCPSGTCVVRALRWVQMVTTSMPIDPIGPLGPPTSPYIDPYPDDDGGRPFYFKGDEIGRYTNGENAFGAFNLRFYDFSKRPHPPTSAVNWGADLYLVSWDGSTPGTVTIHDGIRWGWIAGCSDPQCDSPTCGDGVCCADEICTLDCAGAGACCLSDEGCVLDATQDVCVKLGGRYMGDGTTACFHNDAGDCIPTVSEWGIVVMTMLLLTVGTVVMMRRRLPTRA